MAEEQAKQIGKETEESKKPEKKAAVKSKRKLQEAAVNARDLSISPKHSIAICNMIKKNSIERAIADLQAVVAGKKAVPMYGDEIPHRGGMMSGRYPIKAAKQFIKLLRNLSANASVNGLEISRVRIAIAKANLASRKRYHRKFRKFKRTHVTLIAKERGGTAKND
ncbi:50S ribosomal protein L22 [Candidatus Pacearchaeota archaeon]|nr:50S ribosomal protein L22 [Candidatus Pacearchaeota archaeon]